MLFLIKNEYFSQSSIEISILKIIDYEIQLTWGLTGLKAWGYS